MALDVLVIGCSLNPQSFSQVLAREVVAELQRLDAAATLIDLREQNLPLCDGGNEADAPAQLTDAIVAADAVVLSVPVYNFSTSAAAKNLIELTGAAWRNKVVALACAAGGFGSYMAPMGLANSLMLDFQCLIVPRLLYTTGQDYAERGLAAERPRQRLHRMTTELIRIASALKAAEIPAAPPR